MKQIDPAAIERLPKEEQDEARKLLEALQEKYEQNPLLRYEPYKKQIEFHQAKTRMKVFYGGNRAGKTTAGILDDIIQAVDKDCLPAHLLPFKKFEPPFYGRIIVPGFHILEGVVFQKLREWTPKDQLVGGRFDKAYEKSNRILRFKNGSFFDFLTFDQELDKHGGAAKHRVHYDEEPPFDIRQEGSMRLIDYKGADEIFTMTPTQGLTWMYDTIWEPWEKGKLKNAFVVVVDMDDNPYLDEEQKEIALQGYSQEELKARKEGRFVHFAGMIYPEFSRMKHVIPEKPPPKGAYIYVGIDPGIRVMAAAVWTYMTPEGQMVVFDELGLQGCTVADVARAIKLINLKHGESGKPIVPRAYVIDPAARNIVHQTGRSDQMEFTDHGIYTVLGQNAVPAGINRIKERLETGNLQVMANCPMLIDEFRKYRWKTPSRTEGDPKEQVVKEDDHLLDALRYVVQSRPYGPPDIEKTKNMTQVEFLVDQERKGMYKPKVPRVSGIPI